MDYKATAGHDVLAHIVLDDSAEPTNLPLLLLKDITNGFSDDQQIGRDRFAVVYKGKLGNATVAVKKLSNMNVKDEKFYLIVDCLMKLKHKNVVRFLGYCAEADERLLCFEYLAKGSLDVCLTDDVIQGLERKMRYEIIRGICEGLHYVQQNGVVHLELNSEKILLDENMVPKIGDFGFSKCLDQIQSETIASMVNVSDTYFAPELCSGRMATFEANIHSLGLVLKEVLLGIKLSADPTAFFEAERDIVAEDPPEDQALVRLLLCEDCRIFKPTERPSTQQILDRLDEIERTGWYQDDTVEIHDAGEMRYEVRPRPCGTRFPFALSEIDGVTVVPVYHDLLEVHPMNLGFPLEPSNSTPSLLHLTNKTDHRVLFRLMEKERGSSGCFPMLPIDGNVPPMATHSIVVNTEKQDIYSQHKGIHLIVKAKLSAHTLVMTYTGGYSPNDDCFSKDIPDNFAQERNVTLRALSTPHQQIPLGVSFRSERKDY